MTGTRRLRFVLPSLGVLAVAAWAMSLALTSPAAAFKVEDRGTAGLDGKVVMSPATEVISTVDRDGGDQVGPGDTIRRAIIIDNRTEEAIDFDLDVAEAVGAPSDLKVEIRHGVRGGAAAWAQLERSTVRLKPGQQGTIGVTVRVPRGVKPGSKLFAVTATRRSATIQTSGAGIAPEFRQVGLFIVDLPGDAPVEGGLTKATITSVEKNLAATRDGKDAPTNPRLLVGPGLKDAHTLNLVTEYENTGERLLRPSGRIVVRDLFGRTVGRYAIKEFNVYPAGGSAGAVELKGLPSLGVFRAEVQLESAAAGKQTTTLPRFVMVPKWFLAAIAAFVLYGIFRLVRWQLRRRREWRRYLAADGGVDPSSEYPEDATDVD